MEDLLRKELNFKGFIVSDWLDVKRMHDYHKVAETLNDAFFLSVDAGMDMTAIVINTTENYIEYDTGIAMEIPEGYVGLLFPRSSNSQKDLLMCNSVGVVDSKKFLN